MVKTLKFNIVGGDPAALSQRVDGLHSSARSVYNKVVGHVERQGRVPRLFDLYKLLTQWREEGVVGEAPTSVQRAAIAQGRTACLLHKKHIAKLFSRLQWDLDQEAIAAAWLAKLPEGMEAPDSPKECKAWLESLPKGLMPSKRIQTALQHKSRKRVPAPRPAKDRMRARKDYDSGRRRPALTFSSGVKRVDARTVQLPDLGRVRLSTDLKASDVILSAQVVERTLYPQGRRGGPPCPDDKRRFALHVQVYRPAPVPKYLDSSPAAGVDVGIRNAAAISDGRLLHLTSEDEGLDLMVDSQRRQSRMTKWSCAWREERDLQKGIWDELLGRRTNEIRHMALRLAEGHSLLAVEDLRLGSMLRSAQGSASDPGRSVKAKRKLNRRLARASLGQLLRAIAESCAKTGTRLILVPAQGTSQTCAACGCRDRRNRESQSSFACIYCWRLAHADINASQVVLDRAVQDALCEALRQGGWDGRPARLVRDLMRKASMDLYGNDRVEDVQVADWVRDRQSSGRLDSAVMPCSAAVNGGGAGGAVKRLNSTSAEPAGVELSI